MVEIEDNGVYFYRNTEDTVFLIKLTKTGHYNNFIRNPYTATKINTTVYGPSIQDFEKITGKASQVEAMWYEHLESGNIISLSDYKKQFIHIHGIAIGRGNEIFDWVLERLEEIPDDTVVTTNGIKMTFRGLIGNNEKRKGTIRTASGLYS